LSTERRPIVNDRKIPIQNGLCSQSDRHNAHPAFGLSLTIRVLANWCAAGNPKEMVVASLRRRCMGVMVRELDSDLLILDTEAAQIHQLNRTASFIWRNLDDAPAPEQLAGLLVEAFDVEEQVALTDVLETLQRFRGLNLIVEA
jgi:hypothetical protein